MGNNWERDINILETIKSSNKNIKYFHPFSSNMFGNTKVKKQDETTNFNPQSIYALAKVSAFYICNLYMQFIYAINICNPYMQSIYMQSIHAMYMRSAYAIYICNLHMHSIYDIYILKQYGRQQ